ncbi:hypothetical protein DRE_00090 [Drechslerella stenobrocha 248]|uniref:Uncharacterized protein n=1 Tax=Drechslerella stenobrocha 248 TaxID=1043628 RepID=W7IHP6_9PEZI|nr:hypothetical protein DRE_00090 [Drechslerella stenobrocha 248]
MILGRLFGLASLVCLAEAWYQAVSADRSPQSATMTLKVFERDDEKCHSRALSDEGVLGVLNVVNSRQTKALVFYNSGNCNRERPNEYSLFVHLKDENNAIQVVDMGVSGMEHSWTSYRSIDPDSTDWTTGPNTHGNWYTPLPDSPSGRTRVGQFFADLMAEVPPGSIRFRVKGTKEYITVDDAMRTVKTVKGREIMAGIGPTTLLSTQQLEDAKAELRYALRWFYTETGGEQRHSMVIQRDEMKKHLRLALLTTATNQLLDPGNPDPRVSLAKEMHTSYRDGQNQAKLQRQQSRPRRRRNKGQGRSDLQGQSTEKIPFPHEDENAPIVGDQQPGNMVTGFPFPNWPDIVATGPGQQPNAQPYESQELEFQLATDAIAGTDQPVGQDAPPQDQVSGPVQRTDNIGSLERAMSGQLGDMAELQFEMPDPETGIDIGDFDFGDDMKHMKDYFHLIEDYEFDMPYAFANRGAQRTDDRNNANFMDDLFTGDPPNIGWLVEQLQADGLELQQETRPGPQQYEETKEPGRRGDDW